MKNGKKKRSGRFSGRQALHDQRELLAHRGHVPGGAPSRGQDLGPPVGDDGRVAWVAAQRDADHLDVLGNISVLLVGPKKRINRDL